MILRESISVPLVFLSSVLNLLQNKSVTRFQVPCLYEQCLKIKVIKRPLSKLVASVGITWAGMHVVCVEKRFRVGLSQC